MDRGSSLCSSRGQQNSGVLESRLRGSLGTQVGQEARPYFNAELNLERNWREIAVYVKLK